MSSEKSRQFYWVLAFVATIFLASQFYWNFLHTVPPERFVSFDRLSESLVLGGMAQYLENPGLHYRFHLGLVTAWDSPDLYATSLQLLKNGLHNNEFAQYQSQIGIQGLLYGAAYAHGASLVSLKMGCAVLTAFFAVLISGGLWRAVGVGLGVCFYISILLSPWMMLFASHLYWSPFLWLAPFAFGLGAYLADSSSSRCLMFLGLFGSFLVKCLAGYEYISTITILACSIFVIDNFLPNPKYKMARNAKYAGIIALLCVLAFGCAFLMHAGLRGQTLAEGVKSIIEFDVKRRTLGADPSQYPEAFRPSLTADPLSVLWSYVMVWDLPAIYGARRAAFAAALLSAVFVIGIKFAVGSRTARRDAAVLFVFFAAPASWYVLARSHSYVHTHLNYVLWSLGTVPAILFVNGSGLVELGRGLGFRKAGERLG